MGINAIGYLQSQSQPRPGKSHSLVACFALSLLYYTVEGLGEGHFVVVGTGALPFSQIYWWITVNNLEGSEERHSVSLSNSVGYNEYF